VSLLLFAESFWTNVLEGSGKTLACRWICRALPRFHPIHPIRAAHARVYWSVFVCEYCWSSLAGDNAQGAKKGSKGEHTHLRGLSWSRMNLMAATATNICKHTRLEKLAAWTLWFGHC
jgi:hypothetical protein